MDEPEILSPEEERLLSLAVAIADGTPVNWTDQEQEQEASGHSAAISSQSASLAPGLRILERIVRGHQVLHYRRCQATVLSRWQKVPIIENQNFQCRLQLLYLLLPKTLPGQF